MEQAAKIEEQEEWRVIEDFPDYAVSNWGRVKRIATGQGARIRILRSGIDSRGYSMVGLHKNKRLYTKLIHHLVLNAFIGKRKDKKFQCNHIDGNKQNNFISNLEWTTPSENVKHAFKIGLRQPKFGKDNHRFGNHLSIITKNKIGQSKEGKYIGEKNPNTSLTNGEVFLIKKILWYKKCGYINIKNKQIALMFKSTKVIIGFISQNKTWKHILYQGGD